MTQPACAEKRGNGGLRRLGRRAAGLLAAALLALPALAQTPPPPATDTGVTDPPGCQLIRLSDIGWTDVTSTTAIFSALVRQLGYRTQITVLSVPVTYASLKNKDIDVFLGNWMPSMEADRRNYVADGSVEVIRHNLTGAKYTLAVPAYTYADCAASLTSPATRARSTLPSTASSPATTATVWCCRCCGRICSVSAHSNWWSRANRGCSRKSSAPSLRTRRSYSSPGIPTR
jgi:ABC-type proline/glycine betaine transport system substrate-binding protein